ncbi:MAG: VWA domain-containing protein [Lentisphaerae bacterium]|nr:VWA domain-containing protein [Lentisphaerota bacterium]
MKFVDFWLLWLIIPVLCAGTALYAAGERRRKKLLGLILGKDADNPEACTLSRRRRNWKFALQMAAVILLIIAAARPYIRESVVIQPDMSRDIMVVFDVSKSMRAVDLPPSRMEQAKFLVREVVKAFPGERFGLIPFAGTAFVSCPLTADHHTFMVSVDELDPGSVPLGGTDLGKALQTAYRAFAGAGGDHRAVMVLTDGDELSGDAGKAVTELKSAGIPLIVIGFGSPDAAAPVPDDNGRIMHSASGEVAGSKLNEKLLEYLAQESGGIYVRSTVSDTGFTVVKDFISKLNRGAAENVRNTVPDDLFIFFIAAALVMLIVSGLLPEYRNFRRKTVKMWLLLAVAAGGFSVCSAAEEAAGEMDAYGQYEQARNRQLAGDPMASELYGKLISGGGTPPVVRSRALQNLGIVGHNSGREQVIGCRQLLQQQNLDKALGNLNEALKKFAQSRELYTRSMEFRETADIDRRRINNYQQLILDMEEAEKLKKQIEELKKQQQQTQQQTRQAQQQNQQTQQQNQQTQQQNQQAQQQNQQAQNDKAAQASADAAESARELEKQARQLEQQKLADKAGEAAEKLEEAEKLQKDGKTGEAEKKINEAMKELQEVESGSQTGEDGKKEQEQSSGKPEEKDGGSSDGKAEKNDGKTAADREKEDAGRRLDILEDEAKELQEALRRQRNLRRRQVQKDW